MTPSQRLNNLTDDHRRHKNQISLKLYKAATTEKLFYIFANNLT